MFYQAILLAMIATPSFAQMVHDIQVGGPGMLTFTPDMVQAAVGDTLNFVFHQANHTATQSAFSTPCVELMGADGVTPIGFDSGFMPVAADMSDDFPNFAVVVNDTKPIWVFCRQTGHCGKGMVFAANAPATGNTFAAFQALAIAQNGTASNTSTASASMSSTMSDVPTTTSAAPSVTVTAPPSVVIVTVTATVTVSGSPVATTYGSYPNSPAPTVAAQPMDHKVIVGGTAGLVYSPSNVSALIGDTVTFEFHSANHTATQSSFSDPCRKLQFTSTTGQVGFDSGFMPVSASATNFPTYTIQINSTSPVWVYCAQTGHCGKGMVFAVNAPLVGNTYSAFEQLAIQINGTSASSSSASSTASAAPSATTSAKSGARRSAVANAGGAVVLLAAVFIALL